MNEKNENTIRRMTKQKKVILEKIRKLESHPTADELYHMVRKELPKISLGTVYRNLEQLSQMGEIKKLDMPGQKRFDGKTCEHYHVRCVSCGKIDDVMIDQVKSLNEQANMCGYKIFKHNLEFEGLCPECQKKEK